MRPRAWKQRLLNMLGDRQELKSSTRHYLRSLLIRLPTQTEL